jgi:hypothetical protein
MGFTECVEFLKIRALIQGRHRVVYNIHPTLSHEQVLAVDNIALHRPAFPKPWTFQQLVPLFTLLEISVLGYQSDLIPYFEILGNRMTGPIFRMAALNFG